MQHRTRCTVLGLLASLLTQYGRHPLIGCSRPGSLPANLQDLWNDSLTAPWNVDCRIL